MVVVVKDRDVPVTQRAVRPEAGAGRVEGAEVVRSGDEALTRGRQGEPGTSDVEGGAEIVLQHRELVEHEVLLVVTSGDLSHQEEVPLAEGVGILADRAAEVARLLHGHVLHRVDPEPVAVGERDPVAVAGDELIQGIPGVEGEVLEGDEVGALLLGVWVLDGAGSQDAVARPGVASRALQLPGPDAFGGVLDASVVKGVGPLELVPPGEPPPPAGVGARIGVVARPREVGRADDLRVRGATREGCRPSCRRCG